MRKEEDRKEEDRREKRFRKREGEERKEGGVKVQYSFPAHSVTNSCSTLPTLTILFGR